MKVCIKFWVGVEGRVGEIDEFENKGRRCKGDVLGGIGIKVRVRGSKKWGGLEELCFYVWFFYGLGLRLGVY